jgi:hypothetical protein
VGFRRRSVLPEGSTVSGGYVHEADIASLHVTEYPDGTLSLDGYAEWIGPGGAEGGKWEVRTKSWTTFRR